MMTQKKRESKNRESKSGHRTKIEFQWKRDNRENESENLETKKTSEN